MVALTIEYAIALGCIAVIYVGRQYLRNSPLPPGPLGLPWVGNIFGIDKNAPWLTYREWAKTYGDIVYSRLMGKDIIIINSEKIAKDLLDNNSSNYSDRPYLIANELCGLGFNSVSLPYGDTWRLHRRFFHQNSRSDTVDRFLPLQHYKACQLLRRLFDTPEQLDELVFEYTSSIILRSTYDYDPPYRNDELIKIVAKVQKIGASVVRPEISFFISAFPALLNIPAWFPGMEFKKEMETADSLAKYYVETAFEHALQRMRGGSFAPCMVHDALRNVEEKGIAPDKEWMTALKETAATAFLAGSETSHSVLMTFILMMMLNPEAQDKAQAQIDAVVGNSRLPSVEDRPLLPFVDAILWETLRYYPIAPLSIPHASMQDDVYAGFHIPKGSIILANLWSMGRDESKFPNPDVFMPERFLNGDGSLKPNQVENIAFGFGRRICVGRYFADVSVWATIAKLLSVFKVLKPLDENGAEMTVEPKFSGELAIRPLPFKCRIVPRFPEMGEEKLEELIAASTP